ncbi:MAG TPA: OmpA family protein, partial [Gammaproteobacteria bacterium]|nr:OmpA family protein [Gammaproteobacteria bacterium]
MTGGFGKAWAILGLALLMNHAAWAAPTPAGTTITNTAQLAWDGPGGAAMVQTSNSIKVTVVAAVRTPSSVAFLSYAPGGSNGVLIGPTGCSTNGGTSFTTLPAPVSAQGQTLDISQPQAMHAATLYYPGDPVFVDVTDGDQNLDPAKRETVLVMVSVQGTSRTVTLRLIETGNNTGVFAGYVQTVATGATAGACTLAIKAGEQLQLDYTDAMDAGDQSQANALVDPYNVVFDSATGKPVNGAEITLVNAATGTDAAVTGRDGVSSFPSTVTSGKTETDGSGAQYPASAGAYLLPEVTAGNYKLKVTPPPGYRFASSESITALQQLPQAPFVLGKASFGQSFTLSGMGPVGYDIPLDPVSTSLFVQKTAAATSASVGDMLQFTLTAENTSTTLAAQDVMLVDTLPQGFRYVQGSARLGGKPMPDPSVSADAQQLTFTVGRLDKSSQVRVTYVVEVSAATPLGTAINSVQGFGAGQAKSNVATAQVEILNELMQNVNTVIGRVMPGCDKAAKADADLSGIRILMEDGSYAITDKNGRFHFQAVKNGTHVVQLDTDSLPTGYEITECTDNTRFAGRAYSQFIELHGGALWRTDFHIRKIPAPSGALSLKLAQKGAGDEVHSTVELAASGVPVTRLSVTVMLPDELSLVPGSATLDGKPIEDPQDMSGALVFRLPDAAAGWHGTLGFELKAGVNANRKIEWTTLALANFDTPAAKHQHTPMARVAMPVTPRYVPQHRDVMVQDYPFARYQLGPEEQAALNKIINSLQYARNISLVITGYTDNVHVLPNGNYENNQQLGLLRAKMVEAWLRRQIGLDWNRVKMS